MKTDIQDWKKIFIGVKVLAMHEKNGSLYVVCRPYCVRLELLDFGRMEIFFCVSVVFLFVLGGSS